MVANRCYNAFSPRGALDIALAHQPCNAPIAHANAFIAKVSLQPRAAIVAARFAVQDFDAIAEHQVALAPR
jgi:hypothetical protein